MALVKCEDCGGQVSDKATACPNCGAPPPLTDEEKERVQEIVDEEYPRRGKVLANLKFMSIQIAISLPIAWISGQFLTRESVPEYSIGWWIAFIIYAVALLVFVTGVIGLLSNGYKYFFKMRR